MLTSMVDNSKCAPGAGARARELRPACTARYS